MKLKIYLLILGGILFASSCSNLDLTPSSSGSSENWYSTETEVRMAVNDLYRMTFWEHYTDYGDGSDDNMIREYLSPLENGTITGQTAYVKETWEKQYKVIARANGVIHKSHRAVENGASQDVIDKLVAEAHFHRACAYAKLVPLFGDVPLVEKDLTIQEAFKYGRTDKKTVMEFVYKEFDEAVAKLDKETKEQRATKGAALALKARFALYMEDWRTAADASKAVMDLRVYELHKDYSNLFLSRTKQSKERVFTINRSVEFKVILNPDRVRSYLSRNAGGFAEIIPSWDLFAAYTCTDGLPINKSPLFNPQKPFENRDPRCAMTLVPFGKEWLGFEYNPHPEAVEVMNYKTGKMVKNNDTRKNLQFASFNGMMWKKGIDEDWLKPGYMVDPDLMIIRYAEVLLIFAEAKMELNEIDQPMLDALNAVRARAYGVDPSATSSYPAFSKKSQEEMRIQIRTERRVELTKEDLRYMDLLRWKHAERVMTRKGYGMLYPVDLLMSEVVEKGEWFWAFSPDIDKYGLPDFTKLEAAGKIHPITQRTWLDRQYLWPIPTSEILINSNMKQNPGY